jgi:hypothetical protein
MRIYYILLSFMLLGSPLKKVDTQKLQQQISSETKTINTLLERWHKAAADADFDAYFACMDDEAYYIGTDKSEKWSTKQFKAFCKPHFEKGSAWDFKSTDREVYLNEDQSVAWFDEKLDTWMGVCMASGVLLRSNGEWKIKHYQLSMAVPNEIVDDFIQLVENHQSVQKND